MNVTATVSPTDINRLQGVLMKIENNTRKMMPDLIKQTTIFAIQSAVKATEPGTTGKVSKLAQKYKFRPLVSQPPGTNFYVNEKNGYTFETKTKPKRLKKRGLRRAKMIKIWSRKKNRFDYLPTSLRKRDKTKKIFKIPHAGAAKAGWLFGLRQLGKTADTGEEKKNLTQVTQRMSGDEIGIQVTNLVDYVAIISPASARIGVQKATSRLEKTYMPRIEKKLQQTANQ